MRIIFVLSILACRQTSQMRQYTSSLQQDQDPDIGVSSSGVFLYSSYFGLDNTLPKAIEGLCARGANGDGMPVVFSKELDIGSVQPVDIKVTQASGNVGEVYCTTFLPAIDDGELRTVLLIGEFGTKINDEPIEVEVIGNVYDHSRKHNFKGTKVQVTALAKGPFLVRAEPVRGGGNKRRTIGPQGSRCPESTKQAVRVVWSGGITKPGGKPADEQEGVLYQVVLEDSKGERKTVHPFMLADLGDGDNNHILCLSETGTPISVSFPKGHLTDPNEDASNPDTNISVTGL